MGLSVSVRDSGDLIGGFTNHNPTDVFLDDKGKQWQRFTIDDIRHFHIHVARGVIKEEVQSGNFPSDYITEVDRKFGVPLEVVKFPGQIRFIATSAIGIQESLKKIYENILDISRKVSGDYVGANCVYYNGRIAATSKEEFNQWIDGPEFEKIKTGDTIRFVNLAPYARRLEKLGVTATSSYRPKWREASKRWALKLRKANKPTKVLAPNGVYKLSERFAKTLLLGSAKVQFEFVSGAKLGVGGSNPFFPSRRTTFDPKRNSFGGNQPYLYPTILIGILGDKLDGKGLTQ